MANSFFKKFSIQRFFNPANGPSEHVDTMAPAPEKVDLAEVAQSMENPDGSINHGSQGAELGKALDAQKEVQDQVMKTVQETIDNPNTTPEMKEEYQAAVDKHDEGVQKVEEQTQQAVEEHQNALGAAVVQWDYNKREHYSEKWEGDKLSLETMIDMIADLDGAGWVERHNRSWIRKIFTGNDNGHKFIIGEQQIKNAMLGMDMNKIDALYQKLTGATDSLQITKKDVKTEVKEFGWGKNSRTEQVRVLDKTRIKKFQEALLNEVEIVNSVGQILMKDEGYSSGLMTVLKGWNDQTIVNALNDPDKVKEFQDFLAKSPAIKKDTNLGFKIANALMRVGVTTATSIVSGGIVGVRMESENIKTHKADVPIETNVPWDGTQWDNPSEKEKTPGNYGKVSVENMSAKYIIGPNGKSVALNFDLVGVTGEVNWNDKAARIDVAQTHFNAVPDKRKAYQQVIQLIEARLPSERNGDKLTGEDRAKNEAISKLTQHYVRMQETALAQAKTPEDKRRIYQKMMENTKQYAAAVEDVNGMQLKGAYAQIGLSGLAVGLAANKVEISATDAGVNKGSASIEAKLNGAETISDATLELFLKQAKVERNAEGQYVINGKPLVVPEGKQVQWSFERLFYMDSYSITAQPSFVDVWTKVENHAIEIDLWNPTYRVEFIEKNSKQMADFMLKARTVGKDSKEVVGIQTMISNGDYENAAKSLKIYLDGKKSNKFAQDIGVALESVKNNPAQLQAFLDTIFEKTSGGNMSRKLAEDLRAGKDISKQLQDYYKTVGPAFARWYGISPDQVKSLADQLIPNITPSSRKTLWDVSKSFNALVAYSQVMANKQAGFKGLDRVTHRDAQIAGEPVEVTDKDLADKIRQQMNAKITEADIQAVREKNKDLADMSDDQIRVMMLSGPVKAYMSFVENAECFNLGFLIEPKWEKKVVTTTEVNHTEMSGSDVGRKEVNANTYGLGVGVEEKETKEEKPEEKNDSVKTEDNTTVASNVNAVSNPEDAANALQQTANQTVEATANLSGEAYTEVKSVKDLLEQAGEVTDAAASAASTVTQTATEVTTQAAGTVAATAATTAAQAAVSEGAASAAADAVGQVKVNLGSMKAMAEARAAAAKAAALGGQ